MKEILLQYTEWYLENMSFLFDLDICNPLVIWDKLEVLNKLINGISRDVVRENPVGFPKMLSNFCEIAIIWDKPKAPDIILGYFTTTFDDTREWNICRQLSQVCHAHQRDSCETVLVKYHCFNLAPSEKMIPARVTLLLSLLNKYRKPEVESIVVPILEQILRPTNHSDFLEDIHGHKLSCLHYHNRKHRLDTNNLVRTSILLLNYGPDINCPDGSGKTPLRDLLICIPGLSSMPGLLVSRQTLELYIFENPDPDLHKKVVMQAMGIDRKLVFGDQYGSLVPLHDFSELRHHITADGKPHTILSHKLKMTNTSG